MSILGAAQGEVLRQLFNRVFKPKKKFPSSSNPKKRYVVSWQRAQHPNNRALNVQASK